MKQPGGAECKQFPPVSCQFDGGPVLVSLWYSLGGECLRSPVNRIRFIICIHAFVLYIEKNNIETINIVAWFWVDALETY